MDMLLIIASTVVGTALVALLFVDDDDEAGGDFPVMILPQSPKRAINVPALRNDRRARAFWWGRPWFHSDLFKQVPAPDMEKIEYAKMLGAPQVLSPKKYAMPYTYNEPVPISDFRLAPIDRARKAGIDWDHDMYRGEVKLRLGQTAMIVPDNLTSNEWSIKFDQLKMRERHRTAMEVRLQQKELEHQLKLMEMKRFECGSEIERMKQAIAERR